MVKLYYNPAIIEINKVIDENIKDNSSENSNIFKNWDIISAHIFSNVLSSSIFLIFLEILALFTSTKLWYRRLKKYSK